jgi:hypothetical protein
LPAGVNTPIAALPGGTLFLTIFQMIQKPGEE